MKPELLIIDLFCGAGGTTTGFAQAELNGCKIAKVIACVNHDPIAITSHEANHPEVLHFIEDIRTLKLAPLVTHVRKQMAMHPDAKVVLWASLECTNFSKAKGGQPRDADSRTLAYDLLRYIDALKRSARLDAIQIENVEEFMSWGPLDDTGRPISKRAGLDYLAWVNAIISRGFRYDWRLLNSADYGAYTSRVRYFGVFASAEYPIVFPEATHQRRPKSGEMFDQPLKPWKAVREVLDLQDEGADIFVRKKPLSEKTLERIEAGLIKFVAGGKKQHEAFTMQYNSGKPEHRVKSMNEPVGTLTTSGQSHAIVQTVFMVQRNTGNPSSKTYSVDKPSRTLTQTGGNQDIVCTHWIDNQYGASKGSSIDDPNGSLTANPKQNLCEAQFIARYHGNGHNMHDANGPSPTITTNDAMATVKCFLMNPSWGGNPSSIDEPGVTVIARQDKAPLYLVQTESGDSAIAVYETDSPCTIRIKQFMAMYGIVRITMRMLKVSELKMIQGFPADYQLHGNQTDQKKFIGNAVVPVIPQRWAEATVRRIREGKEAAA